MKKSLSTTLWFSIALTLLIACSDQGSELAISPSETPLILATIAATQTQPIPSRTPTDTQIPTLTPYPSKQVIFNYSFHGLVSLPFDDIFLDQPASKLVLYSDGQMLHFDEYYKQNYLTHDEIEQFLLKLEKNGLL